MNKIRQLCDVSIFFVGIKTLQQFGGANAIDSYMQSIIEASGTKIPTGTSSILYGLVSMPAGTTKQHFNKDNKYIIEFVESSSTSCIRCRQNG